MRSVNNRTLFHLGDAGGHAHHDPGLHKGLRVHCLADEVLQHSLGNIEVCNHAILHGADSHDIAGSTANHTLCFLTHGQHIACITLYRNDRRLAQDNAPALHMHERISRAKIYAHVV